MKRFNFTKKLKPAVLGFLWQGLQIASGLVIVYLGMEYLDSEDLSFWYFLISIFTLASMIDYGYILTTINVSAKITKNQEEISDARVEQYKRGLKVSFVVLYAFYLIFMNISGLIYLSASKFDYARMIAWEVFICGLIVSASYKKRAAILNGCGKISESYKSGIVGFAIFGITVWLCLSTGLGTFSYGIGVCLLGVVGRSVAGGALGDLGQQKLLGLIKLSDLTKNEQLRDVVKITVASVGAFAVLRGGMLYGIKELPSQAINQYSFLIVAFFYISTFARIFLGSDYSRLAQEFLSNNYNAVAQVVKRIYISSALFYFVITTLFWIAITWFHQNGFNDAQNINLNLYLAIAIVYFLELIHSIACGVINSSSDYNFYYSSLCAGVINIALCVYAVQFLKEGVWGLILAQFLAQLLFNNWYWPFRLYITLKDRRNAGVY